MNMLEFLLVLAICFGSLTCNENELYVLVEKQSMKYAIRESYDILDGDTVVATSPVFTDNRLNKTEYCIPKNDNLQYSIKLKAKDSLGWQGGSYVLVKDIYSTIVFKGYPLDKTEETFPISFYKLLMFNSTWKMTKNPEGNWKQFDYDDSEWEDIDFSQPQEMVSGSLFFRKKFSNPNSPSSFAAYEARFMYNDGAVVYMNGKEVYRDCMPDGPIEPTTNATKATKYPTYRGYIRPFNELLEGENILVVELHYVKAEPLRNNTFNAMISVFPANIKTDNCFVIGVCPAVSEQGKASHGTYAFNHNYIDYWNPKFADGLMMLKFTYNYIRPVINTLEIYPGRYNHSAPVGFVFSGSSVGDDLKKRVPIMNIDDLSYIDYSLLYVKSDISLTPYQYWYMNITHGHEDSIKLPEVHPAICSSSIQPIFAYPSYTWQVAEYSIIYPTQLGFSQCSIEPALPTGLMIDYYSCTISGIPTQAPFQHEYTITSGHWSEYHTTFTLSILSCPTNPIEIERVYRSSSNIGDEGFTIIDEMNHTIWSETTPMKDGYKHSFCLNSTTLYIHLSTSETTWQQDSYLYIRSLLDNTNKTLARYRYDDKLGLPHDSILPLYVVNDYDEWYYMMKEIPYHWYNESIEGWSIGKKNEFPKASSQLQFFKRQFDIVNPTLVAGLEISIRHRYGLAIYLNSHEIYNWGVKEPITNETFSGHAFEKARVQTLQVSVFTKIDDEYHSVLQEHNTIAIAIVAVSVSHKECYFSASIRPVLSNTPRLLDYHQVSIGLENGAKDALDDFSATTISNSGTIYEDYIEIDFIDNRECINAVSFTNQAYGYAQAPTSFTIKGRELRTEEWIELKHIENVEFWKNGQQQIVYFDNNQAYGQYQVSAYIDDMKNHWYLSRIMLYTVNRENENTFKYPYIQSYVGFEMNRITPNTTGFSNFSIKPTCSLHLDSITGSLSGIPSYNDTGSYIITAENVNGLTHSTAVFMRFTDCPESSVNLTISIVVDTFPSSYAYSLYDVNHNLLATQDPLRMPSEIYSRSFCVHQNDYFIDFISYNKKGWSTKVGYFVYVQDMLALYGSVGSSPHIPSIDTLAITTKQVIRSGSTLYRMNKNYYDNWYTSSFDDSTWEVVNDQNLPIQSYSLYLRTVLPAIQSNHTELSIQLSIHSSYSFIVYHNNHYLGENQEEFQIADDLDRETILAIEFSTTSLPFFCNINAQYSYSSLHRMPFINITSTPLKAGLPEYLLDSNATTAVTISSIDEIPSVFTWETTLPRGSTFNRYSITTYEKAYLTWSFYGRTSQQENEDWTLIDYQHNITLYDRRTKTFDTVLGRIPFKYFMFSVFVISGPPAKILSLDFHQVLHQDHYCRSEGEFYAVSNYHWSYAACDSLHVGYRMRQCLNGTFEPIINDYCLPKYPSYLHYSNKEFTFYENEHIRLIPEYDGILEEFIMKPEIPGLTISDEGIIEGKGKGMDEDIEVIGMNGNFTITTQFHMKIVEGKCCYHDICIGVDENRSVSCKYEGILKKGQVNLECIVNTGVLILRIDNQCKTNGGEITMIILGVCIVMVILIGLIWMYIKKQKDIPEKEALV